MSDSISFADQQMALALAPAGVTAVAVFPPFAIPRTLPALVVIFKEENQDGSKPVFLKNAKKKWQEFKCNVSKVKKFFGFGRRKPAFCDQDRLEQFLAGGGEFPNFDECEDECSGQETQLYGFRANVTLSECTVGVDCDMEDTLRRTGFNPYRQIRRQTGEEFFSEAPPDCRNNNICQ